MGGGGKPLQHLERQLEALEALVRQGVAAEAPKERREGAEADGAESEGESEEEAVNGIHSSI